MTRKIAALVGALFVCTAGLAQVADAKPVKFRLQIEAKQTTNWKQPYYETANNCYNRPWSEGEGGEVVKFRGSGIAYAQKVGRNWYFTYGSPNFGPSGKHGITLKATNERRYRHVQGNKPGPCGGGSPEEAEQVTCGTRSGKALGQLSWDTGGKRLRLRASLDPSMNLGFDDCPIWQPDDVTAAGLTDITQKAPSRELLDPNFKEHIVIARKNYKKVLYPDAATITSTTGVYWKVTLRRLG
jgi:hypothetical protein